MHPRLRGVRLRAAHLITRRSSAGQDQAHPRRTAPLSRAAVLVSVLVGSGLLLVLRPGDVTRATAPWAWSPLPATAFGPLRSPGQATPPTITDGQPTDGSQSTAQPDQVTPVARVVPAGDLTAMLPPAGSQSPRADSGVPANGAGGSAVTVRGNGPDAPSITARVQRPSTAATSAPKGPTHVVVPGDNLWTIASRHAADLTSILRWNDGVVPDRLVAGQRVLVPGGSKMTPVTKPAAVKPRTISSRSATVPRPATIAKPVVPRVSGGAHLWPLAFRGQLTRRYSAAHPGIDIAVPQGTPVRAIAAGTVVWSGWKNNGGGYVVEVSHPNGMRSIYNHNSKLTVRRGDKVAKGETIALVGSTGNSTGPHLDIRIWMAGRLVDPLRFY